MPGGLEDIVNQDVPGQRALAEAARERRGPMPSGPNAGARLEGLEKVSKRELQELAGCKFMTLFPVGGQVNESVRTSRYDFLFECGGVGAGAERMGMIPALWDQVVKQHLGQGERDAILTETGNALMNAISTRNAAMARESEAHKGLFSDIWPCYREVLAADDYYLSVAELAVVAHAAKRNVVMFIERTDVYVIDQYVSRYEGEPIAVVLERSQQVAAAMAAIGKRYHRSHFSRLVVHDSVCDIKRAIQNTKSEAEKRREAEAEEKHAEKMKKPAEKSAGRREARARKQEANAVAESVAMADEAAMAEALAKSVSDETNFPGIVEGHFANTWPVLRRETIREMVLSPNLGSTCTNIPWLRQVYARAAESAGPQKKVSNVVTKMWNMAAGDAWLRTPLNFQPRLERPCIECLSGIYEYRSLDPGTLVVDLANKSVGGGCFHGKFVQEEQMVAQSTDLAAKLKKNKVFMPYGTVCTIEGVHIDLWWTRKRQC